ncbi:MAG: hypothetical protein RLZZ262_31 [Bacteroidota bacterium]
MLKEKGDKKKELRKFNLYQLHEHIINQFNRMEARSLQSICDLIQSAKRWSQYVDRIWKTEFSKISDLPFAREVRSGHWEVAAVADFAVISHSVIQSDSGVFDIPTCDCATFRSSLIPCAGICTVFSRISNELFNVSNVHPRWRLQNHPLYIEALGKLNLCDRAENATHQRTNASITGSLKHEHDLEVYNSIVFPQKRDVRYTKLNQQFKRIEGRVINNEHAYKLMMMNLVAFENSLHGTSSNAFLIPSSAQPNGPAVRAAAADGGPHSAELMYAIRPPTKRGRASVEDDKNRYRDSDIKTSNYVMKWMHRSSLKRKPGKCQTCTKNGVTPSDNHRAGSSKCPCNKSLQSSQRPGSSV